MHASGDLFRGICGRRMGPLGAVTIPVLELQGDNIIALTSLASGAHGHNAGDLPEAAGLPGGFSALWLRTDCIKPPSAGHPVDGAAVAGVAVQPAEDLCRFLGLAPRCYQEFRLFTFWHLSVGTERKEWLPNGNYSASHTIDSLRAVAAAMQQAADAHKLVVSVSDDEAHVLVTRSTS